MAHKEILIAVGLALIATPAASRTTTVEQKARPAASAKADTKKYCIQSEAIVGSRISKTSCKTKAEWAREDVDIDELKKNGTK